MDCMSVSPLNDSEDTQTMGPDPTMSLLGRVEHTNSLGGSKRRSHSPPATCATAPSPSGVLLRPRISSPLRHARTRDYVPPPSSPHQTLRPRFTPSAAALVTNAVLRCAYQASMCTARCSANRAGSNMCGDTCAKSGMHKQRRSTLIF